MTEMPSSPVAQRSREMIRRTIGSWIEAARSASESIRYYVWKKMVRIPPPPVPPRLREMLKDYPELIEELQTELNSIVDHMLKEGTATPPFERAVWTLEDSLSHFRALAQGEVRAAEAEGDPLVVEKAKRKRFQIDRTRSDRPWHDHSDQGLWNYFQTYKAAFK